MKRLLPLVLLMLVCCASAAPNTLPVTDLTNGQVTFNADTGTFPGLAWFEWGKYSDDYFYWSTLNQTMPATGIFYDVQYGSPLLTCSTYYVRACDQTGCDLTSVMFTVPQHNMPNQTAFGTGVYTMFRSGLNVTKMIPIIMRPYAQGGIGVPIISGALFFFIIAGLWVRPKDVFLPVFLIFITSGVLVVAGASGAMVMDQTFIDILQGVVVVALAGTAFSWFFR